MELTTSHTTISARFLQVREQSTAICKHLAPEDYVVQPVPFVSPPKWHLAHTTWFFETFLLAPHVEGYQVFDPNFSFLFNSYYETVGKRVLRTNRGNLTRPGVDRIYAYRTHVDKAMSGFLGSSKVESVAIRELVELGLQHEQQHQELLLTDIKYILGNNPLFPAIIDPPMLPMVMPPEAQFLNIEEGIYEVGHVGEGFSFDNELGRHKVFLPAYRIMDRPVTNAEYMEFIEAGGYQAFRFWLAEGWDWVNAETATAPMYWHKMDGQWMRYALSGLTPVHPNAPVTHLNYYEADAYARWKGMRLPTEFEWEVACNQYSQTPHASANFSESQAWDPVPETQSAPAFYGNVWEWTGSAYLPYPGFKTAEGAVGEYNGKFMVSQMVLKGGSCATPANHIRASYRNFFHPQLQWQFTGIRLASHV